MLQSLMYIHIKTILVFYIFGQFNALSDEYAKPRANEICKNQFSEKFSMEELMILKKKKLEMNIEMFYKIKKVII